MQVLRVDGVFSTIQIKDLTLMLCCAIKFITSTLLSFDRVHINIYFKHALVHMKDFKTIKLFVDPGMDLECCESVHLKMGVIIMEISSSSWASCLLSPFGSFSFKSVTTGLASSSYLSSFKSITCIILIFCSSEVSMTQLDDFLTTDYGSSSYFSRN